MSKLKYNIFKAVFCILLTFIIVLSSVPVAMADGIALNCKSAILVDAASGEVIVEKNSHDKLPPASVTKVMTMLLIIEAVDSGKINLDDKVTISKQAESKSTEGTRLLLEAGEVRTVNELLLGIAVESANDACIAMGEYIAGSHDEFVKLMNKRAKELGMNDTTFKNANGLHEDGHETSAFDIAIMSRELLKHQKIYNYISEYMTTVYVGRKNDVKRELVNKNKLVRFYKGYIDGIKTGFTRQAMYCISVSGKKSNLRLISVIMGAPDVPTRTKEALKLLDYGFANYSNYSVAKSGDVIAEAPVTKGDKNNVKVVSKDEISILIKKGEDKNIKREILLPDTIVAPVKKGQQLGDMVLLKDDKEVARFALVSDSDIEKSSFIVNLRKSLQYWFGTGK